MSSVWNIFCDWHLELAKPLLLAPDGPEKQETRETIAFVLDQISKLLHPFMPFLTEELWAITGEHTPRENVLALAVWPDLRGWKIPRLRRRSAGWSIWFAGALGARRNERAGRRKFRWLWSPRRGRPAPASLGRYSQTAGATVGD